MSVQEKRRRSLASCVFREAWKYFKRSKINFSTALTLAWKTVRGLQRIVFTKARGVTKDNEDGINRQRIISRLAAYSESEISLEFKREPLNRFDSAAISIIASVLGKKGSACLGYLSKELAREVAPLLDEGNIAIVFFLGVTGAEIRGLNFAFAMIPKKVSISTMQTYHNKKNSSCAAI